VVPQSIPTETVWKPDVHPQWRIRRLSTIPNALPAQNVSPLPILLVMQMGYRWRRMYYRTGLPGWMRFGYSPGWAGRSPTGLPPGAEWIISSGLLPQYREYLRETAGAPVAPFQTAPPAGRPLTKEQEPQMLEEQARAIESHLSALRRRVEELKKSPSAQESQPYYPDPFYGHPPMPYSAPSPEDELASLEDYRGQLDEEVEGVEARIDELRKLLEKPKEK